jgi:hypothetical protein
MLPRLRRAVCLAIVLTAAAVFSGAAGPLSLEDVLRLHHAGVSPWNGSPIARAGRGTGLPFRKPEAPLTLNAPRGEFRAWGYPSGRPV